MKTEARPNPAWHFLPAFMYALMIATAMFGLKQHYTSDQGDDSSTATSYHASGATIRLSTDAQQGDQTSGLPRQLQGVPFNVALGCWRLRADSRGAQSFHVAAQADYEPGPRWDETKAAIRRTYDSNPGVHYILVTKKLVMLELAARDLAQVPHDLWYCPEVLYGTPIRIGNLYTGPKFAVSVDDWLKPWTRQCTFKNRTHTFVYLVQREDTEELSGDNKTCDYYISHRSADGFLFDYIPEDAVDKLKFPRNFWGCENVAMFVLKQAGITLVNMCPWYAPTHVHRGKERTDGRLRINQKSNNGRGGITVDLSSLCKQSNSSR